jgi:hypothetical protein
VSRVVPADATVAVVSRGDDALLHLDGRRAWHFPCAEDGSYLGYYPETGQEAVDHLLGLMSRGTDYFVLPSTAFWWLEHYPELSHYLRESGRLVASEEVGLVFAVSERALEAPAAPVAEPLAADGDATPLRAITRGLLPRDSITAVLALEGGPVALEGAHVWRLPRRIDTGLLGYLEALVATTKVEFLVVSADDFEWLERQSELFGTLESDHRLVTRQAHIGAIYELVPPAIEPVEKRSGAAPEPAHPEAVPRRSLVSRLASALRGEDRDGR